MRGSTPFSPPSGLAQRLFQASRQKQIPSSTGGTITGVGEVIKARKPGFKVFAVEPEASPVISGGKPGPHKIQGIGAGFIPGNCSTAVIDDVVKVSNEDAFETAQRLSQTDGISGGISTGANVWAAMQITKMPEFAGKTIVTVGCSPSERYLSTPLAAAIREKVAGLEVASL